PVLTLRFRSVRLFDTAVARGTVAPPHPGMAVTVAFRLGGRTVAERHPEMNANGGFTAHLPVREPGTYRVRATFGDEDHTPETAVDGPTATPLPSLRDGSRGTFVRLLERRLVELHYRLAGVNEEYDNRTADAVMAFTKVQRMTRRWTVDASVWRALADPRRPTARSKARGFHIEVDQTRQVLYTVDDGEITNILHVSTGAGGATHDGSYRVYRKLAGFSANHLYYPSYFDGLRAIHGWTEVPSYPASHGCVRVRAVDLRAGQDRRPGPYLPLSLFGRGGRRPTATRRSRTRPPRRDGRCGPGR
ncbi:MAG: L,D-transpeptidase family protein, partial [Actinobacteria bacterium]|nr:L,D-transpeptidase family protein [Actinomycetota bacterium]